MLLALIVACEVGFWVLLGAGLAARYLLRRRRLSIVLLVATPVVDVVLFVATMIDLRRGAEPTTVHGLAVAYVWFSVAFGHSCIRWVDDRVAHRFFGGPPPWRPPRAGRARTAYEWREWRRGLVGLAVAWVMVGAGALVATGAGPTLAVWGGRITTAQVIWLFVGPVWASLSGDDQPDTTREADDPRQDREREGDRPGPVRRTGGAADGRVARPQGGP